MNGVMSNGFSPVARSKVGSTVSLNCTTQLGHQASTWPVFDCDSLLMVLAAKRAERLGVAGAQLAGAAAMGRPAHDLVVGAEHIHDVEAQQRDVRRLEHVAAGVEHHVRQFGARAAPSTAAGRAGSAPPRKVAGATARRRPRRACGTALTPFLRRSAGSLRVPHHGEPRHGQQEARIDAVVAGLDALAAHHAGLGPLLRLRPGPCRGAGCRARPRPRPSDRRRRARRARRSDRP